MTIKLLVLDNADKERCKAIASAFSEDDITVSICVKSEAVTSLDGSSYELPDRFDLLVLHNNNLDVWEGCERYEGLKRKGFTAGLVIRYKGTGDVPKTESSRGLYWIQYAATCTSITAQHARCIIDWFKAGHPDDDLPEILGGWTDQDIVLSVLAAVLPYCWLLEQHLSHEDALARLCGSDEIDVTAARTFEPFIRRHLAGQGPEEIDEQFPSRFKFYRERMDVLLQENADTFSEEWQHWGVSAAPDRLAEALIIVADAPDNNSRYGRLSLLRDVLLARSGNIRT